MRKYLLLIMMLFAAMLFSACSNQTVYDNVNNEIIIEQLANGEEVEDVQLLTSEQYLRWCNTAKWYAPFIIAGSLFLGVLLFSVFKKEKKIRRAALFVFILGIPVCTIIVVYVVCYLYGKFF